MENSELLERFLPGYRIVCRIFARYLGIDLTDFMSKAFVLFALLKSAQYLWSSLSGILGITLTSSIEVPEGKVYDDVLHWVSRNVLEGRGVGVRALSVASSNLQAEMTADRGKIVQGKKSSLLYEPAFDSTLWFLRGWHVVTLRRQRGKSAGGDTILLTYVGLTTAPLRDFLDECVESSRRATVVNGNGKA